MLRPAVRNGGILAVLLASAGALLLGARAIRRRRASGEVFSFRDHVIVVTGGSRGLGYDIAKRLVDEGAKVAILARDPEELGEAVTRLTLDGGEAMGIPCDVAHEPTVRAAITRIVERYGHLDGVVNAAGLISVGPRESLTRAGWHDALATSFWGPLHLLDATLPHLRRREGACIVRIGRAAVDALADDLHAGLEDEGIRVITIDPGMPPGALPAHPSHTWFDVAERFPVLPIPVESAGEKVYDAMRHGLGHVRLGPSAVVVTTRNKLQAAAQRLRTGLYRSLPYPLGIRNRWRAIRPEDATLPLEET